MRERARRAQSVLVRLNEIYNAMQPSRPVLRSLRAAAFVLVSLLAACSSHERAGTMELVALGSRPLALETEFISSAYVVREAEDSFWFSDISLEQLLAHDMGKPVRNAVFLHAQLVWTPKPGMTPLDPTATNLVTRVVVVSEGEVGLYGGAAFARPSGEPGSEEMELVVEGGTLSLLSKTKGFHDLLSPVGLTGTFVARHAPDDAGRWRRALAQFVTNALGTSTWVDASDHAQERTFAFYSPDFSVR